MTTPAGNQPQVDRKTKVYGSAPVQPLDAGTRESRQPPVIPVKVYGVKQTEPE